MKTLIAIFLFPVLASSQVRIDFGRYTHVWVLDMDSSRPKFSTNESIPITAHANFPLKKLKTLSLYIPDNNDIVFPNGNRYIRGYLINASSDTVLVDRCDATIYPAETQILVNSEWKTFQISMGSSCGNSDFKSLLLPRSYYLLNIERPNEGDIKTKFRFRVVFGDKEYVSNAIRVNLTKEEIQKAGVPIKPRSM